MHMLLLRTYVRTYDYYYYCCCCCYYYYYHYYYCCCCCYYYYCYYIKTVITIIGRLNTFSPFRKGRSSGACLTMRKVRTKRNLGSC